MIELSEERQQGIDVMSHKLLATSDHSSIVQRTGGLPSIVPHIIRDDMVIPDIRVISHQYDLDNVFIIGTERMILWITGRA